MKNHYKGNQLPWWTLMYITLCAVQILSTVRTVPLPTGRLPLPTNGSRVRSKSPAPSLQAQQLQDNDRWQAAASWGFVERSNSNKGTIVCFFQGFQSDFRTTTLKRARGTGALTRVSRHAHTAACQVAVISRTTCQWRHLTVTPFSWTSEWKTRNQFKSSQLTRTSSGPIKTIGICWTGTLRMAIRMAIPNHPHSKPIGTWSKMAKNQVRSI